MISLIDEKRTQYKANLHSHSTLSDGRWTPEQAKEEFKKRGYSVLALTDHERLVDHSDLTDDEILFLTSYEMQVRSHHPYNGKIHKVIHFNLYAEDAHNTKMVYYTPEDDRYHTEEEKQNLDYYKYIESRPYTPEFINQAVADAKKLGFIACYNHPSWSLETEQDFVAYDGFFAMEIFNTSSYVDGYNDVNESYYNTALRAGKDWGVVAADDNHNKYPPSSPYCDAFGGFTYILADELTYSAVFKALQNRSFYASTGARIFSLTAEGNTLSVKTSPASRIAFVTNVRARKCVLAEDGPLTQADFEIQPFHEWVRVEVTDADGKRAFSRAYRRSELGLTEA